MAEFKFEGAHSVAARHLRPTERPTLSESTYVITGQKKPVSGPELLKAISRAKLSARDAETILGIPRNTLIRKASELGTPFNSNRATRSGARKPSTFNTYAPLGKPPASKAAPAKTPAKPAANANVNPSEQPTVKPVIEVTVPDTAKPLKDVPDGGCEQYLGTRGGVPVYCGKPGEELPRRDGPIFRCAAHRSSGTAKAKLG